MIYSVIVEFHHNNKKHLHWNAGQKPQTFHYFNETKKKLAENSFNLINIFIMFKSINFQLDWIKIRLLCVFDPL